MLLVICCWGVHTEHKGVYHGLVSTNGLSTQSIYCLALKWPEKRQNCATFLWNPGKSLNILNGCSLLFVPLRFGSCLAFFYGKISAVYCEIACFDTYVKGVNLSRQGKHVLCILERLRLVLHFISARRQLGVLGLESDFAPRQDRHRSRSLVGMLRGVGASPSAPYIWLLSRSCRTRRWHSRPSNIYPGLCRAPSTHPRGCWCCSLCWYSHIWAGCELRAV